MSLGLHKGYTKVDSAAHDSVLHDDLPGDQEQSNYDWLERAAGFLTPVLLWTVFACSMVSLVNVLQLPRLALLQLPSTSRPTPGFEAHGPPGTVEGSIPSPLFPLLVDNATIPDLTEGGHLHFISPVVISQYRRFESDNGYYGGLDAPNGGRIHLSYKFEPFLRFQDLDPARNLCAIGVIKTGSEGGKVSWLGLQTTALVWKISLADATRPAASESPRRDHLGEIDVAVKSSTFTNVFRCPYEGSLVVQLDCKQWNVCHIDVEQPIDSEEHFGVQLIQWSQ